jgi:hypothetical protein
MRLQDLIDGAAAPFYKAPYTPKEFLWQNYVNMTLPAAPPPLGAHLILYILQMPSADQASGLYTALLQESEYTGHDWEPTSPPWARSRASRIRSRHGGSTSTKMCFTSRSCSPRRMDRSPDYAVSDPDLKAKPCASPKQSLRRSSNRRHLREWSKPPDIIGELPP